VIIEPTQLRRRKDRHLDALKHEIARCLEKELSLRAEERQERSQRLGIDWNIAEEHRQRRRSRLAAS